MNSGKVWLYHQCLRSCALVFLALLIFDSGFLSPLTKQLSDNTYNYVASVISVGAAVAPTELNTLTAELTAQKKSLEAKERALDIALKGETSSNSDISTYVLSVLLFIILVLITLNYALDYARERRRYPEPLKPSYE